jgi:tRNA1(Val) A37 N6-methylase TrmN6
VLLAAAVPANSDDHVLELGCGVGGAALCLLARVPGARVTGLELQPELAALARANAEANGVADSFEPLPGDLLAPPVEIAAGGFDHAMANPPYLEAGRADAPADPMRAAATVEGPARLADWVAALTRLVRRKGTVTVIHRADRLADLLDALARRAGELVVLPLWPSAGAEAKRVLVRARVGVGTPLRLTPGLVLHEDGGFTAQARAVLEEGAPLQLRGGSAPDHPTST